MTKPALETTWGGSRSTHTAIVASPLNPQGDLVLRSEVYVQGFFSLQRHEYHYKVANNSDATAIYCDMRVEWLGPEITWSYVPPGRPVDNMMQSFFSPQFLRTTANADAFAGKRPFTARAVRGEEADAYVPWVGSIPRILKGLWPLLKGVLIPGGSAATLSASIAWEGSSSLDITSSVRLSNPHFLFSYDVVNRKDTPIRCVVRSINSAAPRQFEVRPEERESWAVESSGVPAEAIEFFEYQVPGWENLGWTRFPVAFLVPDQSS